ncbi:probable G-protein coupled receptor 25 [Hyperolius riggenbachi]|uniref:probable G-protein coupled receptor 25 n=1 Tax=Hyperolius riggenbachi TaxID=752182 RepID=UPI0035A34B85
MATESSWIDRYDYFDFGSGYDNGTEEDCLLQALPHARWILPTLYSIFFILGLLGNMVVIAVVSMRSSRRADTFILNLATSDLIFILTLPLWASSLAQEGYWSFGIFLCRLSSFATAVTRCSSSLLMAIMSVDRYLAVIKGTKVHPLRTRSCSILACGVIWFVSLLIGCPSLITRNLSVPGSACEDSDLFPFISGFKIAVIFLTFAFPFAVVVFCYCRMAKYLWNYFASQEGTLKSTGKPRRGHSWLRIVTCIVGVYCFSWLPFNTLNTLKAMEQFGVNMSCSSKVAINQALSAASALAFANSCTNPLIYGLLDTGFKRRAQLAMPRLFLTCRTLLPIPGWTIATTSGSMESTSTYTGNR